MSVKESRNRFLFFYIFENFKKKFTIIVYKNIKIEMKNLKNFIN